LRDADSSHDAPIDLSLAESANLQQLRPVTDMRFLVSSLVGEGCAEEASAVTYSG
jgi:hypothetical protein